MGPALGCPSAARASRLPLRRFLPSSRRCLLRVEGVGEGEGHGAAQARLFELLEPEAGQVPVALGPAAARGSAVYEGCHVRRAHAAQALQGGGEAGEASLVEEPPQGHGGHAAFGAALRGPETRPRRRGPSLRSAVGLGGVGPRALRQGGGGQGRQGPPRQGGEGGPRAQGRQASWPSAGSGLPGAERPRLAAGGAPLAIPKGAAAVVVVVLVPKAPASVQESRRVNFDLT